MTGLWHRIRWSSLPRPLVLVTPNCSITMSVMQPCPRAEFQWIQAALEMRRARNAPNRNGDSVSQLVPTGFVAYAKILHSVRASYTNIDDPHPLTEREIAILRIPPCTKLRSFVETLREEGQNPRIRWKTLAKLLGVPFKSEICLEWFRASMEDRACWARFLSGPDDGNLNAEEFPEVVSILRAFSRGQDCFFRFARWSFTKMDEPPIFRGELNELAEFLSDKSYRFTPEYWWPADRSWCVCSEYDLKFTIVGGPKELVSAVLTNPTLEALEVTSHTRTDDAAPMPQETNEDV
jgi:hypothetical protein